MKSTRAAIRYARALILESAEADSLELIHDDMLVLSETFDQNVELNHMVDSLVIKNSVKLASLKLIFKNLSQITLKLIDVLFPVFFIIGVGYYLGKKDPNFDTTFITNFAGNIGTPAMIFYTITTTGVTLDVFIEYFIYAVIIIAGFAIVGFIFLFILKFSNKKF